MVFESRDSVFNSSKGVKTSAQLRAERPVVHTESARYGLSAKNRADIQRVDAERTELDKTRTRLAAERSMKPVTRIPQAQSTEMTREQKIAYARNKIGETLAQIPVMKESPQKVLKNERIALELELQSLRFWNVFRKREIQARLKEIGFETSRIINAEREEAGKQRRRDIHLEMSKDYLGYSEDETEEIQRGLAAK